MDIREGEIICINKPYGMTSFAALAFVRTRLSRALGVKRVKIGHAGTLDPLATGVLVLCTGKATKRIGELQNEGKEYTATLQFGATTASFDMEHPESERFPTDGVSEDSLREVLKSFTGEIMQVPPAFSACYIGGERAYDLARRGEAEEPAAKRVRIDSIELLAFDDDAKRAVIRVACGKGTYIRALARDIGRALGSGAYLTQLTRTRAGNVRIEDCLTLDEFPAWLSRQTLKPYNAD
ncbi:MAG: tRNA pseudouridine(55) synthase TruB [Prevotella sp.]|nr:tRNA pseudouridine(55) synthase TruB [Prevotella sp.]